MGRRRVVCAMTGPVTLSISAGKYYLASLCRKGPGCLHLLLKITGCNNSLPSAARGAECPCKGWLDGLRNCSPVPGPAAMPG